MQHDDRGQLPKPDDVSASHSARVEQFIRERIVAAGGSISFAEFMQHALYAPGLGYYAAGAVKFGEAGDFITAPEVSELFGAVLARQCAEVLAVIENGAILEYGAGSGKLAADLLLRLATLDALPTHYDILEVSADLGDRQRRYLRERIPGLFPLLRWVRTPPSEHTGVIIANEVLDALPVERFLRTSGGVRQLRVMADNAAFRFVDADAPAHLQAAVQAIEEQLGVRLPEGYVSEVSAGLPGWIADIATRLREGISFFCDYGVSRREYYAADRSEGWLRCHFRHRVHSDPLILPGIQDLTAWVDFTAVAEAALDSGLDVAGYTSQAQFLLGGGLDSELQEFSELPTAAQIRLSSQVKMLTLPGEMGEHFKCMALRRGDVPVPSAFDFADRTHTL
jgi:SAM-dependent MidA family methyltransferase